MSRRSLTIDEELGKQTFKKHHLLTLSLRLSSQVSLRLVEPPSGTATLVEGQATSPLTSRTATLVEGQATSPHLPTVRLHSSRVKLRLLTSRKRKNITEKQRGKKIYLVKFTENYEKESTKLLKSCSKYHLKL